MTDLASTRPDVPGAGLFNRHQDAVAEASFRAAITQHRYRVRWEPNNRWWQITAGSKLTARALFIQK